MTGIILRGMDNPSNIAPYQGLLPGIGQGVYLHASVTIIGNVVLGNHVSVWPGAVLRGDVNRIEVGEGSNVQDLCVLHVSRPSTDDPQGAPLRVGRYVTIGHRALLHGCTIGDECLIGMGAIILDRAVVQPRVLLGAGSLVTERSVLQSGYLYLGAPARRVRALTASEIAGIGDSAQAYISLKNNYLQK